MSHKNNVFNVVVEAAYEVERKQMEGTWLPYILVKVNVSDPHIGLQVIETGKPDLINTEDIAIFEGCQAVAWSLAAQLPGIYVDPVGKSQANSSKNVNFTQILHEIENSLIRKDQKWLRTLGLDPKFGPAAMLTAYLRRGEVLPAALLAHAILYPWSQNPDGNWYAFFRLCDRLLAYRNGKGGANTMHAPEQLAEIVGISVANFSKMLNIYTAWRFDSKRPLTKLYFDLHVMLLQRLRTSWRNVKFTHEPHPRVTAMLL